MVIFNDLLVFLPDLQVSIMGLKPGYAADTHSAALFWNGLKL